VERSVTHRLPARIFVFIRKISLEPKETQRGFSHLLCIRSNSDKKSPHVITWGLFIFAKETQQIENVFVDHPVSFPCFAWERDCAGIFSIC